MSVRFILGKDSPRVKATEFVEEIADDILSNLKDSVRKEGFIPYRKFNAEITKRVTNSLNKAMDFAINNMIGSKSGRGTTTKSFSAASMANSGTRIQSVGSYEGKSTAVKGKVTWKSLDYATQKKKAEAGKDGSAYFIDDGDLKAFLVANRQKIVKRTGVISVSKPQAVDRYGKVVRRRDSHGRFLPAIVELAKMDIRILPNIPASFLPGMGSGDIGVVDKNQRFESNVIQNIDIETKLLGPSDSKQRALLQPVFTFWTNHYVPYEIGRALKGL